MNEISTLMRDMSKIIYFSLPSEVNNKMAPVYKDERGFSPLTQSFGTLTWDFPEPRTMKYMYLLFKPPSLWHLLWQPKLTKTQFKQFFGSFSLSASSFFFFQLK